MTLRTSEGLMDVAESLAFWTYDTVVTVVERHEFEPARFDYKTVLHPTIANGRDEQLASVRHTTCSMANGSGGYILFGVRDRKMAVAAPKDRIVGIPVPKDPRKEFADKLKPIERDIYFDAQPIPIPGDAANCIFVVHVPTSPLRPHTCEGAFYIRGEGGTARPMSYFEVRDQMLYTEGRLQKVTLLRLELATFVTVLNMLHDPTTWAVRLEPSAFKVLLADVSDMLPPESGLLALLHDIGSRATILNPLLDKQDQVRAKPITNSGDAYERSHFLDHVLSERTKLVNICGQAQNRLEGVFGPLKTS